MKTYLVTGGAGFIASNFIITERKQGRIRIINLDLLTYAGNLMNLGPFKENPEYIFIHGDIGGRCKVRNLLQAYHPTAVINFAAESHVDRSIDGPEDFIQTNVLGTLHLLEEVRRYWNGLRGNEKEIFRFLHGSQRDVV